MFRVLTNHGVPDRAARARASAQRIIVKLSSAASAAPASLALLRVAFPDVPFAYVVREPPAILASLLNGANRVKLLQEVPCLRWRGRLAAQQLTGLPWQAD